jgi:hypothetical protein
MAQSLAEWTDALLGDPKELARQQFELAGELCGSCRDYHALWPYRRLAHLIAGVEGAYELLRLLLRASIPPNGSVLIAGCADAGMLALASKALEGIPCSIAVADRCLTPLAVCRRYADKHGLLITTHETDLGKESLGARYDVVLGHGSLRFSSKADHLAYLRAVGKLLAPGGTLLQAEPYIISVAETFFASYDQTMLEMLERQGIALPESEPAFRARIARTVGAMKERASHGLGARELAMIVDGAGLVLRVACEYELKSTDTIQSPGVPDFGMQIAVALPPGSSL